MRRKLKYTTGYPILSQNITQNEIPRAVGGTQAQFTDAVLNGVGRSCKQPVEADGQEKHYHYVPSQNHKTIKSFTDSIRGGAVLFQAIFPTNPALYLHSVEIYATCF